MTPSTARLLILLDRDGQAEAVLRRLQICLSGWIVRRARTPLRIKINLQHGREVFACDDASPPLDVPLPAGTYTVKASLGDEKREYTIALPERGSLYLRLTLPDPS